MRSRIRAKSLNAWSGWPHKLWLSFLRVDPAFARGFLFYLRSPEPGPVGVRVDPLGDRLGRRVFPDAFLALLGAVEPVVPDMPPVVFIDEPVVVPLIPVVELPLVVCASANVLVSANAVASAIVVNFMSCPSVVLTSNNRTGSSIVP
jgi:hypothetical protein